VSVVSMKALLETGVHFGHRTRKWNPRMKQYIFTERNGIHILDLQQTIKAVEQAYQLVRDTVTEGGTLLFVGTKRQAQETIAREAQRCNMPYVNQRWLGGTLTNWRTISQRIEYLKDLERRRDEGEFDLLTKKEALMRAREIEKLQMRLGGIRDMKSLPGLLFVVDTRREHTAVREANTLGIPVIALVDTNCDPDLIDCVIPANDDAIRAIKLLTSAIADAVLEGISLRKDIVPEEPEELVEAYVEDHEAEEEMADEEYLGEAILAKLRAGTLLFEPEPGDELEEESEQVEVEVEAEEPVEVQPEAEGPEAETSDEGQAEEDSQD
jgi:small subunit ribosomal protein S2